jgi:hypothetical protein
VVLTINAQCALNCHSPAVQTSGKPSSAAPPSTPLPPLPPMPPAMKLPSPLPLSMPPLPPSMPLRPNQKDQKKFRSDYVKWSAAFDTWMTDNGECWGAAFALGL